MKAPIFADSDLGQDSLHPPYDSGDEANGGQIVSGEAIVAGRDTPEVLETAKGVLDPVAQLVGLPLTSVGNRGWIENHCSSLSQKRLDRIASLRSKHPKRISNRFTQQ